MGGQGASRFSPLQVSLVKGRLGTFPNYSALYLKKNYDETVSSRPLVSSQNRVKIKFFEES